MLIKLAFPTLKTRESVYFQYSYVYCTPLFFHKIYKISKFEKKKVSDHIYPYLIKMTLNQSHLPIPICTFESTWLRCRLAGIFLPGRRPKVYHSRRKIGRLILMVHVRGIPLLQAASLCRIGPREAARYIRHAETFTSATG